MNNKHCKSLSVTDEVEKYYINALYQPVHIHKKKYSYFPLRHNQIFSYYSHYMLYLITE